MNILILMLFFISSLQARVIEIDGIESVKNYVTLDSVVFLNIGDTLSAPSSTLADYQWRRYFVERVSSAIKDKEKAQSLINQVKRAIVEQIPRTLVEEAILPLIAEFQTKRVPVLGYTQRCFSAAYAPNNGELVHGHLLKLGIDLQKTLVYYAISPYETADYAFHYGILFTNKNPVSLALIDFFKRKEYFPRHLIVVGDSKEVLEEISGQLRPLRTTFLRYGKLDGRKKGFDPDLGTIQFFAFMDQNQLMKDEEALAIKQANPEVNYQEMLDQAIKSYLTQED